MRICKDDLKKPTAAEYSDKDHRSGAKLCRQQASIKEKIHLHQERAEKQVNNITILAKTEVQGT